MGEGYDDNMDQVEKEVFDGYGGEHCHSVRTKPQLRQTEGSEPSEAELQQFVRPHLYELDYCPASVKEAIPPRVLKGINNYVWYGQPTGDFLKAVLTNDLQGALARADPASMSSLHSIVQYVYNSVPSVCHGSKEKVDAHLKKGRDNAARS